MNTLKILLIASTLILSNTANALSNPVIDQCSEERLNTIQANLEDLKELGDYKMRDKRDVAFVNRNIDSDFKRFSQSCKFEPQDVDKNYVRIKKNMEFYTKIIDMGGLEAYDNSLPPL